MEYKIKFYPAKSERYTKMLADELAHSGFENIGYSSDVVSFTDNGCICKVFVRILNDGTGICVYFADDKTINMRKICHLVFKVASKEYLIASTPHSLKLGDFINLDKKSNYITVQKEQNTNKQDVTAFAKTMGNTTFESHHYSGDISLGNTIALYTISQVIGVIIMVALILSIIAVIITAITVSIMTHTPAFFTLLLLIIPIGIAIALVGFITNLYGGAANEMRALSHKINNLSNR